MSTPKPDPQRAHIALHLAHRWFAWFEGPAGEMAAHLEIFDPQVRLSGHRGQHLFAQDHQSLVAWFATIPDTPSSHHIVHSTFEDLPDGDGVLRMVVAYQAQAQAGFHGSIISYETRIAFGPKGARFLALDKTPILANTRPVYETSWAANRVLALSHAELGGINTFDGALGAALGAGARRLTIETLGDEGSAEYRAILTSVGGDPTDIRVVDLTIADDGRSPFPAIAKIIALAPADARQPALPH